MLTVCWRANVTSICTDSGLSSLVVRGHARCNYTPFQYFDINFMAPAHDIFLVTKKRYTIEYVSLYSWVEYSINIPINSRSLLDSGREASVAEGLSAEFQRAPFPGPAVAVHLSLPCCHFSLCAF